MCLLSTPKRAMNGTGNVFDVGFGVIFDKVVGMVIGVVISLILQLCLAESV